MSRASELRADAERSRRSAEVAATRAAAGVLKVMALEFDRDAERMEAEDRALAAWERRRCA